MLAKDDKGQSACVLLQLLTETNTFYDRLIDRTKCPGCEPVLPQLFQETDQKQTQVQSFATTALSRKTF